MHVNKTDVNVGRKFRCQVTMFIACYFRTDCVPHSRNYEHYWSAMRPGRSGAHPLFRLIVTRC